MVHVSWLVFFEEQEAKLSLWDSRPYCLTADSLVISDCC